MIALRVKVTKPAGEVEERRLYGPLNAKGTPLETAVAILLGHTHTIDLKTGAPVLDILTGEAVLADETDDPSAARELGRWAVPELLYHTQAEFDTRRETPRNTPGSN